MTANTERANRIAQGGLDVERIAQSAVLLKIDALDVRDLPQHPVWPLCRGLQAAGFAVVHLHGGIDYFDEFDPDQGPSLYEPSSNAPFDCPIAQSPEPWIDQHAANQAPDVDVAVDLTNDPESKRFCAALCAGRSVPLISLTWDTTWAAEHVMPQPCETNVGLHEVLGGARFPLPPVARIVAGLALQEVLLLAGGVTAVALTRGEIVYDVASPERIRRNAAQWPHAVMEGVTADVIGAGGIGVHLLESLAALTGRDCTLRIFDPDVVAYENLSLQIAYGVEDLGRPKAEAIADRLTSTATPQGTVLPYVTRYQTRPANLPPPTIRILCPDNFAARQYANDLSVADGIPLVEAGSSPLAAQQRSYIPGKTACLAHRIPNLRLAAGREEAPASCARLDAPTLPGTNMIIGGILAAEALRAVHPQRFGESCDGTIMYDARVPARFGIVERRPPCRHVFAEGNEADVERRQP